VLEDLTGELCGHPGVWRVHTEATERSPVHGQKILRFQNPQRFPKGWAGNSELLHQNGLGGQVIPVLDFPFDDLSSEMGSHQHRSPGATTAVHTFAASNVQGTSWQH
jgi:hypothetical protein